MPNHSSITIVGHVGQEPEVKDLGNTLVMNVYQSHGGVHYLSNVTFYFSSVIFANASCSPVASLAKYTPVASALPSSPVPPPSSAAGSSSPQPAALPTSPHSIR